MKRMLLFLVVFAMTLSLFGCAQLSPAQEASPAQLAEEVVEPEPEVLIPEETEPAAEEIPTSDAARTLSTEMLPASLDLDGDGTEETLQVAVLPENTESVGYLILSVTDADGVTHEGERLEACYMERLSLYDLDGDGAQELFLCGDFASDDYETLVLRYNGSDVETVGRFYGIPMDFSGSEVVVSDQVDILGTWMGSTRFALTQEGFTHVADALWTVEYDIMPIITAQELAVELLQADGSYAPSSLPAGTSLHINSSDQAQYAYFTYDAGEGRIPITVTEYGIAEIQGTDASNWFEELYYAG